jgi:hypothetical protein
MSEEALDHLLRTFLDATDDLPDDAWKGIEAVLACFTPIGWTYTHDERRGFYEDRRFPRRSDDERLFVLRLPTTEEG